MTASPVPPLEANHVAVAPNERARSADGFDAARYAAIAHPLSAFAVSACAALVVNQGEGFVGSHDPSMGDDFASRECPQ